MPYLQVQQLHNVQGAMPRRARTAAFWLALASTAIASTMVPRPSRAPRLRIRGVTPRAPPPRERTLSPELAQALPFAQTTLPFARTTLPSAARIVEEIADPASSLRAAQYGNITRLAELQAAGWDLTRVRERNGCSLTHRAAGSGQLGTLAFLLDRTGCRADHASDGGKKGARGRTALHFSARHNHVACCELLVERGAFIDAETAGGVTPLMWAAHYGARSTAAWLLDNGADPLFKNPKTGCGVAHWCAAGGCVATARRLLELGMSKVSFAAPNDVGHTPLYKAASKGEANMVDFLLKVVPPATILLRDQAGRSAADAAQDAGFPHLAAHLRPYEDAALDSALAQYGVPPPP